MICFQFRNFDTPTTTTTNIVITSLTLRSLITKALADAFGIIGSGIHVDILYWNGDNDQSISSSSNNSSSNSNNNNNIDLNKNIKVEEKEDYFFVGIIKVAKE